MRQTHRAGEKLFVDYTSPTIEVIDPATGEVRNANLFVAALGASRYTYAEATWTQQLPDWCAAHARAFAFIGDCPELVVPDNLKSGVSKACRYEPDLNPSYAQLAAHFAVAVLPARGWRQLFLLLSGGAVLVPSSLSSLGRTRELVVQYDDLPMDYGDWPRRARRRVEHELGSDDRS